MIENLCNVLYYYGLGATSTRSVMITSGDQGLAGNIPHEQERRGNQQLHLTASHSVSHALVSCNWFPSAPDMTDVADSCIYAFPFYRSFGGSIPYIYFSELTQE